MYVPTQALHIVYAHTLYKHIILLTVGSVRFYCAPYPEKNPTAIIKKTQLQILHPSLLYTFTRWLVLSILSLLRIVKKTSTRVIHEQVIVILLSIVISGLDHC